MYDNERKVLADAGRELMNRRLSVGTWGNISIRVEEDKCLITPSGMNYMKLGPNDMVLIDLEGVVIGGKWKPSSEKMLHAQIYKNRNDVSAIIHYHPIFSSILSVARYNIPPLIEDSIMLLGGEIKVTDYVFPGGIELAEEAVKALGSNNAVILANHGAVCVGKDLEKTFAACDVLEKSAQIFIFAKLLGKVHLLPQEDVKRLQELTTGYLKLWEQK
jgi:L-fuculose-phosphate aldolase